MVLQVKVTRVNLIMGQASPDEFTTHNHFVVCPDTLLCFPSSLFPATTNVAHVAPPGPCICHTQGQKHLFTGILFVSA